MFLEPRKTYNYIEHIPAPPRGSKASFSFNREDKHIPERILVLLPIKHTVCYKKN